MIIGYNGIGKNGAAIKRRGSCGSVGDIGSGSILSRLIANDEIDVLPPISQAVVMRSVDPNSRKGQGTAVRNTVGEGVKLIEICTAGGSDCPKVDADSASSSKGTLHICAKR